ncbi:hypothetical protein MMC11_002001 [Xylographa trunciseda]|nr:hypothetical protein [Xylographa trunciseda]
MPASATPATLMDKELWPSQQSSTSPPSGNLPRSCLKSGTTLVGSKGNTKAYARATESISSTLQQPSSATNIDRRREPLLCPTTTPSTIQTLELSQRQASEVDEILEKLGHPSILLEILKDNTATSREDLLSILRDEVRRLRSNLGLEVWDEEPETTWYISKDEKMLEGGLELHSEHSGNRFKTEKPKSMKTVVVDVRDKGEHTSSRNHSDFGR